MARDRYQFVEDGSPHFITCTVVGWLPLFSHPDLAEIALEALRFQQSRRSVTIHAYVILENHLHLVAQGPELSKSMKEFKSYTARSIIDRMITSHSRTLLRRVGWERQSHKTHSTYQIWQEGSHPEKIQDEDALVRAVTYIHANPVRRGYVDEAEHWRYSSARNYAGRNGLIPVIVHPCG